MEQPRTLLSTRLELPEKVQYRSVGDGGEVPERFMATFHYYSAPSGVSRLRLDMQWNADKGEFDVVNVNMEANKGSSISLEGFRSHYVSAIRSASRQVVRARMDMLDGKGGESTLERVANIYRLARAAGEQPTKAVSEQLGISRDAAAQQVRRARQKGLLRPTTPGKVN